LPAPPNSFQTVHSTKATASVVALLFLPNLVKPQCLQNPRHH
jgi:hypothetical protein